MSEVKPIDRPTFTPPEVAAGGKAPPVEVTNQQIDLVILNLTRMVKGVFEAVRATMTKTVGYRHEMSLDQWFFAMLKDCGHQAVTRNPTISADVEAMLKMIYGSWSNLILTMPDCANRTVYLDLYFSTERTMEALLAELRSTLMERRDATDCIRRMLMVMNRLSTYSEAKEFIDSFNGMLDTDKVFVELYTRYAQGPVNATPYDERLNELSLPPQQLRW